MRSVPFFQVLDRCLWWGGSSALYPSCSMRYTVGALHRGSVWGHLLCVWPVRRLVPFIRCLVGTSFSQFVLVWGKHLGFLYKVNAFCTSVRLLPVDTGFGRCLKCDLLGQVHSSRYQIGTCRPVLVRCHFHSILPYTRSLLFPRCEVGNVSSIFVRVLDRCLFPHCIQCNWRTASGIVIRQCPDVSVGASLPPFSTSVSNGSGLPGFGPCWNWNRDRGPGYEQTRNPKRCLGGLVTRSGHKAAVFCRVVPWPRFHFYSSCNFRCN